MDQRIISLYDGFTHGQLSRRDFLDRLAEIAGSTAAAAALLPLLQNDYARAETVPAGDPRLVSETFDYEATGAKMSGMLVRAKDKAKRPAVIVIHENRGLNAHIQDVARRFAVEGFLAFAVDALTPFGGTPRDDKKAREMFAAMVKPEEAEPRIAAAIPILERHSESSGKVGAVGFCWGGGMVKRLALSTPGLDAGVVYYGRVPPLDNIAQLRTPLLLHYAGLDTGVNAGIPAFEEALKANNKRYTLHMYEGVNHAFNNDTSPSRYNKEAAELAWQRTLVFLKEHLGAPRGA